MPVFTSSIEVTADYPTIKPSLNLNFARSRSLDPRITFTRASTATYVGRDGLIKTAGVDEARFDHDPDTLESLGLLIEESRTNNALYSDGFNNAAWVKQSGHGLTSNTTIAPDGTQTADTFNRGELNQYIYQIIGITGTHTMSVWVKTPSGSGNLDFVMQHYNGPNGALGISTFTATEEWQRFSIQASPTVGGGWYPCIPSTLNQDYHVWGAQVEAGTFPTSYIPTAGSSVTRVADEGNITGDAFSSFYNTTEGVLQTEFSRIGSVSNQMVVQLKDSDGSERIEIRGQSSTNDSFRMEVIEGGGSANQEYTFSGSVVANVVGQFAKVNLAYKQNDFASTINGTIASTDNAGDVGVCDRVGIGYANYGIGYNGHIKNIIYYPKRLTNAQLQLLTS